MTKSEIFVRDGRLYEGRTISDSRLKARLTVARKNRDKAQLQIKLWTATLEHAEKNVKELEAFLVGQEANTGS